MFFMSPALAAQTISKYKFSVTTSERDVVISAEEFLSRGTKIFRRPNKGNNKIIEEFTIPCFLCNILLNLIANWQKTCKR